VSDQQIQVAMVVIQHGLCMMPQGAFISYHIAMIIEVVFWVIHQLAFDWGMGSFGYSSMVCEWHNLGFTGCRRA
jgi:hypothetical protein